MATDPSTSSLPAVGSTRARGTLLLADISGYTGFLQGVADAHRALVIEADEPPAAYRVVASLLDGIVAATVPPFRLAKFEGDAVFVVASDAELPLRGMDLVDCLRDCHARFRDQLAHAREGWTCPCDSCSLLTGLDLKFVLHHGDYVVQRVGPFEELLGPDVNVVHRLLKNHVGEHLGPRPYALFSDAALGALAVESDGMLAATESYEGIPPIPVHVLPLA